MKTLCKMAAVMMTLSLVALSGCKNASNPDHVCEHLDEIAKKDGADPIFKNCKFKLGMEKGDPKGKYDTLSKCLLDAANTEAAKSCLE